MRFRDESEAAADLASSCGKFALCGEGLGQYGSGSGFVVATLLVKELFRGLAGEIGGPTVVRAVEHLYVGLGDGGSEGELNVYGGGAKPELLKKYSNDYSGNLLRESGGGGTLVVQ